MQFDHLFMHLQLGHNLIGDDLFGERFFFIKKKGERRKEKGKKRVKKRGGKKGERKGEEKKEREVNLKGLFLGFAKTAGN
jgi:hypothetical protein